MAGGTVAMPLINEGISLPEMVMGLRGAGLDRMEVVDGELRIGAMTTLTRLLEQDAIPMLRTAASRTAGWSIRNMGDRRGQPVHAAARWRHRRGAARARREGRTSRAPAASAACPLAAFYTGFMTTAVGPDELVTAIVVPPVTGRTTFTKLGRKQANTPAVVTVAIHLAEDEGMVAGRTDRARRGGAAPAARGRGAEAAVKGSRLEPARIEAAAAAAVAACEAFSDAVASDWYRRRMVGVVVRRALAELAGPAGTEGA